MSLRNRRSTSKGKRFFLTFLLLLILGGGGAAYFLFFEGVPPSINLDATNDYLGLNGTIHYSVSDSESGIKRVRILAKQGSVEQELYAREYARSRYNNPVGPTEEAAQLAFDSAEEGFEDGPLTLTAVVTDFSLRNWLKGNTTTVSKEIIIDTKPPRIQPLHGERYLSPGGTGIAIYKLSDVTASHGVSVNGRFFHGYQIDESRDDTFICYFALPYDAKSFEELIIKAEDKAGNIASTQLSTIFKNKRFKKDTINVSEGFLSRKIPEFEQYYPEMQGSFIEKYLYANSIVRKQNNKKISELCSSTGPERLWTGAFLRMAGSSRAGFADQRSYRFNGREVDFQVHLGMDIASTRRANVKAANNGVVVFDDYLGIYGNMILLDHGQGVFSLYSHLSQINVTRGDTVEKGAVIGLSGTTGMAGGDHLHFSMLVQGVFVTPKEWWDKQWINVTIDEPIVDSKF